MSQCTSWRQSSAHSKLRKCSRLLLVEILTLLYRSFVVSHEKMASVVLLYLFQTRSWPSAIRCLRCCFSFLAFAVREVRNQIHSVLYSSHGWLYGKGAGLREACNLVWGCFSGFTFVSKKLVHHVGCVPETCLKCST